MPRGARALFPVRPGDEGVAALADGFVLVDGFAALGAGADVEAGVGVDGGQDGGAAPAAAEGAGRDGEFAGGAGLGDLAVGAGAGAGDQASMGLTRFICHGCIPGCCVPGWKGQGSTRPERDVQRCPRMGNSEPDGRREQGVIRDGLPTARCEDDELAARLRGWERARGMGETVWLGGQPFEVAGIRRRLVTFLADTVLALCVVIAAFAVVDEVWGDAFLIWGYVSGILWLTYHIGFSSWGWSPGGWLGGTRIVDEMGSRPGLQRSWMRFGSTQLAVTLFYLPILRSARSGAAQTWIDKGSGTYIVRATR